MTAVVEVNEQYAQKFQQFINSTPNNAIKLTLTKSNVETNSLGALFSMRERYASR